MCLSLWKLKSIGIERHSPLGEEALADDPGPITITDDEDDEDDDDFTAAGEGATVRDGAAGFAVGARIEAVGRAVGVSAATAGVPITTVGAAVEAAVGAPAVHA